MRDRQEEAERDGERRESDELAVLFCLLLLGERGPSSDHFFLPFSLQKLWGGSGIAVGTIKLIVNAISICVGYVIKGYLVYSNTVQYCIIFSRFEELVHTCRFVCIREMCLCKRLCK